jgi:hypothetical protein
MMPFCFSPFEGKGHLRAGLVGPRAKKELLQGLWGACK